MALAAVSAAVAACAHKTGGVARQSPATQPAKVAATQVAEADNSYCFACHANYRKEFLAAWHEKKGVGCADCHGESRKHSSDEDNITPPDRMYAREKISAACMNCHKVAKLRKNEVHNALLAGDTSKKCTECHGKHVLAVRTRRWDKNTGKLVSDDGVRMTQ